MNHKTNFAVVIASLVTFSNSLSADLPGELRACAAEPNTTARLACFDKIAAKVAPETPRATPRVPVFDEPKAELPQAARMPVVVTEETFGLRAGAGKSKDGPPPVVKIASKVAKVETIGRGRLLITLENGQVWEQLTADRLFSVGPGEVVTVKAGTFDSFLLVTTFNRFTTVNRVR